MENAKTTVKKDIN